MKGSLGFSIAHHESAEDYSVEFADQLKAQILRSLQQVSNAFRTFASAIQKFAETRKQAIKDFFGVTIP